MSGELRMVFRSPVVGKWQTLGDDGNEFDRSSDGREQAWREAQAAANLGMPWAGATFRLVDPFEGDHSDDCVLGLDSEAWCDCGVELVVVEERVVLPNDHEAALARESKPALAYDQEDAFVKIGFGAPYGRLGASVESMATLERRQRDVYTRVLPEQEASMTGLGPLVVEVTAAPTRGKMLMPLDGRTALELSRLSPAKVAELWTGRDAQLQVLSNVLHGRSVPRDKRHCIKERMKGRPLAQLAIVVGEVLGGG